MPARKIVSYDLEDLDKLLSNLIDTQKKRINYGMKLEKEMGQPSKFVNEDIKLITQMIKTLNDLKYGNKVTIQTKSVFDLISKDEDGVSYPPEDKEDTPPS